MGASLLGQSRANQFGANPIGLIISRPKAIKQPEPMPVLNLTEAKETPGQLDCEPRAARDDQEPRIRKKEQESGTMPCNRLRRFLRRSLLAVACYTAGLACLVKGR